MTISVFHLYTDLQLDEGLATATDVPVLSDLASNLRTLDEAVMLRTKRGTTRLVELPAIVTGTGAVMVGLAHDPDRDAPYIDLWSPIRLPSARNGERRISVVVSNRAFTFVTNDDGLNAAIALHTRWALDDGSFPPRGIDGAGKFIKEVTRLQ